MIVGIDGRSLAGGPLTRGVALYTGSLLVGLADAAPEDRWRVLVAGPRVALPELERRANVELVRRRARRARHLAGALARRPRLDRTLRGGLDVTWAPAPAPLALSARVPLVLTLHDLWFAERPGDFTPYERLWHRLARVGALARRAAHVIAVSRATADVAVARFGLDPARVTVVAPGVTRPAAPPGDGALAAMRARHGLGERYLLFVGALEPRKAPDVLARAYASARGRGLDAELAVVGAGRAGAALADGDGVRRLGAIAARAELEALYAGALALVMPSRAEGYGLPPLEAAACGTPSVVSDLPAFRETLGDAALRVPPDDVGGLADALVRIDADAGLRARLAAAAAAAVAGRTWERAAQATCAVLREAAGVCP
jgi:glycosyltransferase involved in cell wall biosynthesis